MYITVWRASYSTLTNIQSLILNQDRMLGNAHHVLHTLCPTWQWDKVAFIQQQSAKLVSKAAIQSFRKRWGIIAQCLEEENNEVGTQCQYFYSQSLFGYIKLQAGSWLSHLLQLCLHRLNGTVCTRWLPKRPISDPAFAQSHYHSSLQVKWRGLLIQVFTRDKNANNTFRAF